MDVFPLIAKVLWYIVMYNVISQGILHILQEISSSLFPIIFCRIKVSNYTLPAFYLRNMLSYTQITFL